MGIWLVYNITGDSPSLIRRRNMLSRLHESDVLATFDLPRLCQEQELLAASWGAILQEQLQSD